MDEIERVSGYVARRQRRFLTTVFFPELDIESSSGIVQFQTNVIPLRNDVRFLIPPTIENNSTYHILNGDALKEQFPSIEGTIIVLRECLIMGNVQGNTLRDFFDNRFSYLHKAHGITAEEFTNKGEKELSKICELPKEAKVYLWFERDLFCQVNLWFSAHLLHTYTQVEQFFLVLPTATLLYGFGGMNKDELTHAYEHSQELTKEQIGIFHQLWIAYQQQQYDQLRAIAQQHYSTLPFLLPAVEAQLKRLPNKDGLGYPELLLLSLQEELQTDHFPTLFKAFSKRAPIYGFGDSQVLEIWNRIK